MRGSLAVAVFLSFAAVPATIGAQDRLTLRDAIARAREGNPGMAAGRALEGEADARVRQATAGYLPRLTLSETWQRGNLPVYVFSALLSQRRFSQSNFAIDALNRPAPHANFRGAVTVDQALFDPDVRFDVNSARLERTLAGEAFHSTSRDLALEVTRRFGDVLVTRAVLDAARAAAAAAAEDLRRARDRHAAGMVTEADVLSVEVHAARTEAQTADAEGRARIAAAELNRVMGAPLDHQFEPEPPTPAVAPATPMGVLESRALEARSDVRAARLREQLATLRRSQAQAMWLPRVGWEGSYEWNGGDFGDRAGGWLVGADIRLNLFRGFADRARLAEARHAVSRARADVEAAESAARLEVRSAYLRLEAARTRERVGAAALARARESRRILRDRYEQGLAGVGDVLRASQDVLDTELLLIAARVDAVVEGAALERAAGAQE